MSTFHPSIPLNSLTDAEKVFCELISDGATPEQAAKEANLSQKFTRHTVLKLLSRPEVQSYVYVLNQAKLRTVGASASVYQIQKLAEEAESEAVRLGAAKWVAENAGLGVASRIADRDVSTSARSLSEYSLAELEQLVKTGQETLANLPKLKVLDITTTEPETP
jgi:DNA-binding CsgD family transcriptional regulator